MLDVVNVAALAVHLHVKRHSLQTESPVLASRGLPWGQRLPRGLCGDNCSEPSTA